MPPCNLHGMSKGVFKSIFNAHTHTHTHIYIYIYIFVYSNIKQNERHHSALGEYLNLQITKNPPTEVITTLMEQTLT